MASIIEPGRNCWRTEHADRVAFLVDGSNYFKALVSSFERAKRSIVILGWDTHSEAPLCFDDGDGNPVELAAFFKDLTQRNRRLEIHILSWDFAPIYALEREFLPLVQFRFKAGRRVRLRLASDHPLGASHHQKVVVVDGKVAFVGGLDLTIARWDTPEHRQHDERRRLPNGDSYGPFHDAQMMVDGAAAQALSELCRVRWLRGTGRSLQIPEVDADPWPFDLEPNLRDVDVAIARTQAAFDSREEVREVERLYVDSIASAKRHVYIENQYVTSNRVVEVVAERLREPDGPEFVIVTPQVQSGRLEQTTMGVLRARSVDQLREADQHGRLRVLGPVVAGGIPVNVHAKLMIVDDRFVRIGSSNLSNRSMGLDTECDLAIGVTDETAKNVVTRFRNALLAEHLDVDTGELSAAIRGERSLIKAVDKFRGGERTLKDLEPNVDDRLKDIVPDAIDPDRPPSEFLAGASLTDDTVDAFGGRSWKGLVSVLIAFGLLAAWAWTPLGEWVKPDKLVDLAAPLRADPLGPVIATAAFVVAGALMVPVTALIVVMVVLFGAWVGAIAALSGSLLSASLSYLLGRVLWRDWVRRVGGKRLNSITKKLAKNGIMAIAAVRIVPVAPFAVVNMVAGSARVGLRDLLVGTTIGMAPGIVAFSLASDSVIEAARNPDMRTIAVAAALILVLGLVVFGARRLVNRVDR